MKKKYSLDYNIERDIDRLAAVNEILDTLQTRPSNIDLEQMADYILYGKDENGLNSVQRREAIDTHKRYSTFARDSETKNTSLDALIDNPLSDQQVFKPLDEKYIYVKRKPQITRPKYNKITGELIDPGDSDIPGMTELWERIAYLEHVIAIAEGKVPPDESSELITDSYKLYKLKHQVADMRFHQYLLKDAYKPTIHFVAVQHPQPQYYDWDSDAIYWMTIPEWERKIAADYRPWISHNLDDYEKRINQWTGETEIKWIVRRHNFDWENPHHIYALIDNYSALYMQLYENLYSWGMTLIRDFNRYQDMTNFSPARQYILTRRIDHASTPTIAAELKEKFGIRYNANHISMILAHEIPEAIAATAKKQRLLLETPLSERKRCFRCKRWLPRDPLFFGSNSGRKDGLASNCKECERMRRITRGEQTTYDRRTKDTTMFKMPPKET